MQMPMAGQSRAPRPVEWAGGWCGERGSACAFSTATFYRRPLVHARTQAAASLSRAFGVVPLVVHMPLGEFGSGSSGKASASSSSSSGAGGLALVDLVTLEIVEWLDGDGIELSRRPVTKQTCGDVSVGVCLCVLCASVHTRGGG
jgi:hypothetical protein